MKILMIEPAGRRGLGQYTHNLSNSLAEKGHDVLLATSLDFETKNLRKSYKWIEVFDRFSLHPIKIIKFFFKLKRFNPDIIHIQGAVHPELYFLLWKILKLFTSCRFVYTAHDIFPKKQKLFTSYVLKEIYKKIPHIIVHAEHNRKILIKEHQLPPSKVSIHSVGNNLAIVNELPPARPHIIAVPPKKKIILFFGVIEPQKGILTLLRAFKEVKEKINNAFLLIVGQPFESVTPYKDEITRLKLQNAVTLKLGFVPLQEISAVFELAHLLVLPYTNASQSGVVLTAYSFGKPVVATNVGGLPEIVLHGNTGLVVAPNQPKQLSQALVMLLSDNILRKNMSKNALKFLQKEHSWEAIERKTESIYHSLVSDM